MLRLWAAVALVCSGVVIAVGAGSAGAQVTAVTGSAFGVSVPDFSLFGGAQTPFGPEPTATLPPGGSATAVTGTAPSEAVTYGPATIFSSGAETVSTQGTPAGGSVTSSTSIMAVNTGQLTAASVASACTASASGVSGSATFSGGGLVTSTDGSGNPATTVAIPANPPANDSINGSFVISATDTESFTFIFNEQIPNPDGSLTVNAFHEIARGPTGKGDVVVGQSVCGVTAQVTTTTTSSPGGATTTTTAPAGSTTTTTPGTGSTTTTTATTAPATTTTTTLGQVGGSAFGFYTSVGLFDGPQVTRGPTPSVALPPGGSASPVTASAASGDAEYGPVQVFASDGLDVSTQGTPAGGSVTSSTHIVNIGPGPFTADLVTSTCTVDQAGTSGGTTIGNGSLVTTTDANGDPATTVPVPSTPAPNTTITGSITNVGDSFKYVFNEQVVHADGSITVNAGHEYLLGPTAKGDVIFGQSVCSRSATSGTGAQGGFLAVTGRDMAALLLLAAALLTAGWAVARGAARTGRREEDQPE